MRYIVVVNGKWQGGSFATEAEATVAAEMLRGRSTDQKIEVQPRAPLGTLPRPPAAPSPLPSFPAAPKGTAASK